MILIAALVLASATAQAGSSLNLTAEKSVETPKVDRPKRKRMSTEA
jgi:hypothetical protein